MTPARDAVDPRPLGGTTLSVSPLTVGASRLGRPDAPDGDPVGDPVAVAQAFLTGPYAVVDTSNNYAEGASETALGRAIAVHGLPAGHSVVTKTDADPATGRFDRDQVWRSFEESTTRLGLDRLPLLHLHDPYSVTVAEAFGADGAVQGMVELREQGLVGAIGIAAGPVSLMTEYVSSGAFDALLTHNRYTVVDRRAEGLIAGAAERGMGVFNAAPFGGGLLAGRGTRYAYRDSPPELLGWLDHARALCDEWAVPLPAVALQFSMRHPSVHSTVVGISRPERLGELERLRTTAVPDDFWPALAALGTPPSTLED